MLKEYINKRGDIDVTGKFSTKNPMIVCTPSGEDAIVGIKYITFGKYRVGFIEDEDHQVVGIQSIEISKDLYNKDQLSKKFNYWDVEEYYK